MVRRSGIRILALRTIESDTIVGLKEEQVEALPAAQDGNDKEKRKWSWDSKYAVMQFCDGKAA